MNALERGYNISSITNALGSVESAARSAKAAIDALNNTPVNPGGGSGDGYSGSGSGYSGSGSSASSSNRYIVSDGLNGQYRVIDKTTGNAVSGYYKHEDDAIRYLNKLKGYAKGGIITKDDNNPLNYMAKAVGEDTIIAAKAGESVLTPGQTDALVNMTPILEEMNRNMRFTMPDMVPNTDRSVSNSVGSLVTIKDCNINDTHQFINDMTRMIQKALDKHDERFVRGYRYG